MSKASMDWAERQEYYSLVEEEIRFSPKKGQKWILTFEERHSFGHDIVFHVYAEHGEYLLLVHEIVDVLELELKQRLHRLGEVLSGNFRILMSTLLADLPADMGQDMRDSDPSRFKLSFYKRDRLITYEWGPPTGDFKRIRPVLKLIWAVDEWREGARAMGWSGKENRERKSLNDNVKENSANAHDARDKRDKKGRLDPFGSVWHGGD